MEDYSFRNGHTFLRFDSSLGLMQSAEKFKHAMRWSFNGHPHGDNLFGQNKLQWDDPR